MTTKASATKAAARARTARKIRESRDTALFDNGREGIPRTRSASKFVMRSGQRIVLPVQGGKIALPGAPAPTPPAVAPKTAGKPPPKGTATKPKENAGSTEKGSAAPKSPAGKVAPPKAASVASKPEADTGIGGSFDKDKEIVAEIDVLGLPPPTGILSPGTLEVLGADPSNAISRLGVELLDSRPHVVAAATRVLDDILVGKPDMLSPLVDRFVSGVFSDNQRAAQTSANALPVVARNAPARVARQLNLLTSQFGRASDIGKDGLVRTFAALCAASVAYQKRLEEVIEEALGGADPKTLTRWMEIVLPALKGEPHARARAVIERRVHGLPKPFNQKIADYLRIKLRRPTS